ncbi:hypothetical protein [Bradyrhizobium sp.]|uniref:hypothetical protein n=1 Tax=Bradyrhizobium sp. TaxID=376 RepID=UPI003C3B3493
MFDFFQRATYEAPATVMFGPLASALFAGFAEIVAGRLYLTAAGARYLADLDRSQERAA